MILPKTRMELARNTSFLEVMSRFRQLMTIKDSSGGKSNGEASKGYRLHFHNQALRERYIFIMALAIPLHPPPRPSPYRAS